MQTLNPSFKGACVGPLSDVIYANQQNRKNFTLHILPETIFSFPVAMFFPKNHFLVNEVNLRIRNLQSSGLVERWISNYLDTSIKKVPLSVLRKLNLSHLSGGFSIYLSGCLFGLLCFLGELLLRRRRLLM